MKKFLFIISIIVLTATTAQAEEFTRVYGTGKPNGRPASNPLASALSSVGAYGGTGAGDRVWASANDGGPAQYSRSSIVASRDSVDDFIVSGRRGSSSYGGVVSSALSSSIVYGY